MLRCIHRKKKPRNGEHTAKKPVRNGNISSERVRVENFFDRVCTLWKITHMNPLRADACFYKSVMGRYAAIADRDCTRRAKMQRRYCRRREARIVADTNIRTRLSFSSPSQ
ncbi:hypothetical protein PC115_g21683 [Phytophthora cactorum]|uniref:DDE Tnp4 domain-containing protein n=1 Tax=Phytophthora cactorum TaxID=29920 RepID=A0A8T1AIC5_9STRA|nr:hypothetical protein PC115_g21683 [Phytophthora cactorum]